MADEVIPVAAAPKPSLWGSSRARIGPPLIILVVVLGAWELAVRILDTPSWLLPTPSTIARTSVQMETLPEFTRLTLLTALAGFGISVVLGVTLAAGIAQFRFMERGIHPYIVLANAIPVVAIYPLLTIWLGFGITPRVLTVSMMTLFPIVTNTARGLKAADPLMLELMRSLNANRWEVFSKVQFPSALPYIFAGFRIAATLSLIGAVVAEFYGADQGLGFLVIISASQLQTPQLFVAVCVLALLGISLFILFGQLERMVSRWRIDTQ
jgi:ABC-type nitrate/sulfonate/bicarbonate transport system permease component